MPTQEASRTATVLHRLDGPSLLLNFVLSTSHLLLLQGQGQDSNPPAIQSGFPFPMPPSSCCPLGSISPFEATQRRYSHFSVVYIAAIVWCASSGFHSRVQPELCDHPWKWAYQTSCKLRQRVQYSPKCTSHYLEGTVNLLETCFRFACICVCHLETGELPIEELQTEEQLR